MSTARKILENTFVQVFGRIMVAVLSMVVLKIISRYLGTSGYGDYTTVFQYLAFFGIIADFGIYTISVKEMSRDESKIPMILGNIMGLRAFLVLVAMGLAAALVFFIPSYRGTLIPVGVLIATLSTIFTIFNGTICSVLQTHLKMQYATISMVAGKVISVLYLIWVAYFAYTHDPITGFYQLMWAGVVGLIVNYLITAYYVRRFSPITIRFDFAYWKKMFMTSLPYGLALILSTIYFRIDVLVMTFMLPHSQTLAGGVSSCSQTFCSDIEIGLFGIGMRMLELLVVLPIYFMNSALPVLTRYIEEKSEKIRLLMQYSFDFLVASSLPLLVGGFILARPIVEFVADRKFLGGIDYPYGSDAAIQILLFAMLFSFINTLFGFTLVALNRQTKLLTANAIAVVFNIAGNLLLIPHYGFRGAAITSVISEIIILILTYHFTQQVLGFHFSPRTIFRTLISVFFMGIFVYLGFGAMPSVRPLFQLAVLVPTGAAIYLFFMFKTKAVTPEMIRLIRKREPVGEEAPLPSGQDQ